MGGARPVVARITDPEWTASARFDLSRGTARLLLRMDDAHWCNVELTESGIEAYLHVGPLHQRLGRTIRGPQSISEVRIRAMKPEPRNDPHPRTGPDAIQLIALAPGGEESVLANVDGRYLSTEVAGGFTGRMVGFECMSGTVVVQRFEYKPGVSGAP